MVSVLFIRSYPTHTQQVLCCITAIDSTHRIQIITDNQVIIDSQHSSQLLPNVSGQQELQQYKESWTPTQILVCTAKMILEVLLALLVILVLILGTTRLGSIRSFRTIFKFMELPLVPGIPFISMPLGLASTDLGDHQEWFLDVVERKAAVEGVALFFFMGYPCIVTNKAEEHEVLMSSTKYIDKGPIYHLLQGWLNNGLLLSNGEKWKQRRRMLTPSFHFKILDNNMDCLNRNWREVAKKLLAHEGAPLDPNKYLCRGTLEVISETAMGIKLDETAGCEEYVAAVRSSGDIIGTRASKPKYYSAFIFNLLPMGWNMRKNLKKLHAFTRKIIKQRREAYREGRSTTSHSGENETKRRKRPQPFLDTLIELDMEQKGILSDEGIQEEVDTFMFEGHDTTASALLFAFFELGLNPQIQEKAYQEQFDIFGDGDREATMEDLTKMNYLEQVIKEVLRLYPSVPYMSRLLNEDVKLTNGLVLPRDTVLNILPYVVHRNSKYYPNPSVFDPERFSPEQVKDRHPYAFIPFSAGPRNCIGQRFAMMEMKTALSTLLRFTKIKTLNRREDVKLLMLVIMRPSVPIRVEITPRHPK